MKSNIRYFNLGLALLVLSLLACGKKEKQEDHSQHQMQEHGMHKKMYTCPMPEDSVFSDKPGNCPKCGMELIPVESKAETDTLASLIQPTNNFVVSQLKPIAPSSNKGAKRIAAEGYLTYDPNKASSISARVSGRIERLYVRYNFQKVSKGEKLLDIYSPELLTAQNEYLYFVNSKDETDAIAKNALRSKLINLGMTEGAVSQIDKTGKTNPLVSVYANASGHVHFLNGITDISSHALGLSGSSGSSSMESNPMQNEDSQILREGDYVKTGNVLFTIADQSSIWALFKVLPSDITSITKGEEVEVSVNGEIHEGKVNFIEKSFEDFYTVRVYLECDDHSKLKIGTLVKGTIAVKPSNSKSIWVPALAVLNLGKSKSAVFVKNDLGYKAKAIQTGIQGNDWIEVTSGLTLNDSIAPVASYLVDSEAFIETE